MRAPKPYDPVSDQEKKLAEDKWVPTRWWQLVTEDGELLAESSDPTDDVFVEGAKIEGNRIQRIYSRTEYIQIDSNPADHL